MQPFDPNAVDVSTGAPLPVSTTLNGAIPPYDDPDFMRANLWGMTLPDLPEVTGGARGAAQGRMLTYLWPHYSRADQDRGLRRYIACGYRDWWRSWPDERAAGVSLQQYVDDTKRILDAGLRPGHFLRSKDYDGANPDPTRVDQVVDALLAIDGIYWATHAWEASIFITPENYRAMVDHDCQRTAGRGIRWCNHFQQGYAHFALNGAPPASFWLANLAVGSTRLLYQAVTREGGKEWIDQDRNLHGAWSAGMIQARSNDVQVRLVQGGAWGLPASITWVPFELIAQCQFNNALDGDDRLADEDAGDRKGYEALCAPGPLPAGGYGNGARRPDGWNL